jgi:hypothetical protein
MVVTYNRYDIRYSTGLLCNRFAFKNCRFDSEVAISEAKPPPGSTSRLKYP